MKKCNKNKETAGEKFLRFFFSSNQLISKLIRCLQEMNNVMTEIAGQIMSGNFILDEESFNEMREEYLSLVRTVVDYINGVAYLFQDSSVKSGC